MKYAASLSILLLLALINCSNIVRMPGNDPSMIAGDSSVISVDFLNKSYKRVNISNSEVAVYSQAGEWVHVDSVVVLNTREKKSSDLNKEHLLRYYDKFIQSPKHGGDPNSAKLSFLTGLEGEVLAIHILENVKNACNDEWSVQVDPDFRFSPFIAKGKPITVEYIVTFSDICYCICDDVEKEHSKGGKK